MFYTDARLLVALLLLVTLLLLVLLLWPCSPH